ncbi:hypothetical protein BOTBODRAFT_187823 [Botryobasidium botryosum FD-172 SS1]|uniref:Lysophospholipase NTE1 n=1 Tax=Botryobasidium botryosum (strain FD-172 SS1) TaxID=930990 RepID=A0A067MG28_BOTB1|nr:hypothetical protein BOTBODRAFT_187823 [Botryobasidium botryosum FD-172 SS1]
METAAATLLEAATSTPTPVIVATRDRHPLLSLIAACFSVVFWLLAWTKTTIAFVTISVPRFIYAVLSYSLTLQLNFASLAIIFCLSCVAASIFVRYKYLNHYADLVEVPLEKPDGQELHPDVQGEDPPPAFHNYLDEFLQAIRVFGFLEKPVFHELARHLQTRRLVAGDSLSLDQDKSFYCVVDGVVQVFTKTGKSSDEADGGDAWHEEEMNGYQLLNEVRSGGTLSSLFTILSLFTEDVQLGWQDEAEPNGVIPDMDTSSSSSRSFSGGPLSTNISQLDLGIGQGAEDSPDSRHARYDSHSTIDANEDATASPATVTSPLRPPPGLTRLTPQDVLGNFLSQPGSPRSSSFLSQRDQAKVKRALDVSAAMQGTIARATVDTTLAVIPAEAFRRLTTKFPKSSAHIVQVILTRFSRLTFNAAHKYLGLTTELLRTEKAINDLACHPLPTSFYEGGGMHNLRQRFMPDPKTDTEQSDSEDYFGFQPIYSTQKTAEPKSQTDSSSGTSPPQVASPVSALRNPLSSRMQVQAGDLHSMTLNSSIETYRPMLRTQSTYAPAPRSPRSDKRRKSRMAPLTPLKQAPAGDFDLRDEVMSCIAKSIGLIQPPVTSSETPEMSPTLHSVDELRQAAMFNSSFSTLSLLQTADDTSSVTGASSIAGREHLDGVDNEIEVLFFSAGSTLVKATERNAGLFYVIDGFLDVSMPGDENRQKDSVESPKVATTARTPRAPPPAPSRRGTDPPQLGKPAKGSKHLFTIKRGGIAGYLASLSGTPSYVDIKAKTDAYVGFLPSHALERLLEKRPIVLLTLAKRLISLLSPLVLHIDASLDWMQVNAGQVLWRPGEPSDSFYIVINGRLRALREKRGGGVTIVGEYGQGDVVGELDVITSAPRQTTLHAIRDTELARMPLTLFNAISVLHPQTTAHLLRMIASRVREEADAEASTRRAGEFGINNANLKTVAIFPAARDVPVSAFARKLQNALEDMGAPTVSLNQASVSNHLGRHAFTRMGKLKVAGWLAEQEQRYRIVLYVADSPVSAPWTQTCIRQADYIMIVGMGDDPSTSEYERLLLSTKTTARKELVLLHPDRTVIPGSTREWLKTRPWIHAHLHVELPGVIVHKTAPVISGPDPAAVVALKTLKDKVEKEIEKYRRPRSTPVRSRPSNTSDFARLARRLCGKSIGVVLGGGGARGIAHLGVLRALEERSIPIDHIGGTSIGAFVGGLYAREGDVISSAGRAKWFSARMASPWRLLSDVTYPIVAYTTGHEFNRAIYKCFYSLHIEDMWLPYFCNSSNILTSQMDVHESGYAWRYIRASMTLAGMLPPLCDNGQMLVDGGYIDNLPVSTMLSTGALSTVFAVDVGSLYDNSPRDFGDSVSGLWLVLNRWNPFSSTRNIPPITEIQSRLTYVSSVKTLEEAKVTPGCFYMQMPVQEFGTLQFNKYEEIQELGYRAGKELLDKWDAEGKLPTGVEEGYDSVEAKRGRRGRTLRRNSI